MFHKLWLIAAAAVLSLGMASPSSAADLAGGDGPPRYRAWWGPGFYNGVPLSYGYGLCYVRQLVPTPWGPRWHLVNHCR